MQIPMIKTLLKYRNHIGDGEFEYKNVLCDYIGDSDWYKIESKIESRNPYNNDYDINFTCRMRDDNSYVLNEYKPPFSTTPEKQIDVWVVHVLEFKGKIFELSEIDYDVKEYDY